jgi:hypothetical protein
VYYALTYLGFAAPVALAGLSLLVPYPALLAALAAGAALTLALTRRSAARPSRDRPVAAP